MKKKIIIVILVLISVPVAFYLYKTFYIPSGGKMYADGAFRVVHTHSLAGGLCGRYLIVDAVLNKKIGKINVCEDNIVDVRTSGVFVEVVTSCNSVYRKNTQTGEEGVDETQKSCLGGIGI